MHKQKTKQPAHQQPDGQRNSPRQVHATDAREVGQVLAEIQEAGELDAVEHQGDLHAALEEVVQHGDPAAEEGLCVGVEMGTCACHTKMGEFGSMS